MMAAQSPLKKLRTVMKSKAHGPLLQAYVVPTADAHQNEYISASSQRRAYLTGFTGSSGTAVVTETKACLWTDGRYFLQAEKEMSADWTLMKQGMPGIPSEKEWISQVLPAGSKVGIDSLTMSYTNYNDLFHKLESCSIALIPIDQNLVDVIWSDRPKFVPRPIVPLDIKYTGKSLKDKAQNVRDDMKEKNASVLVLTALDDIAWFFNLRGSDIPYNPVFFSYAVISNTDIHIFVCEDNFYEKKHQELFGDFSVQIHSYDSIKMFLKDLCKNENGKIWISNDSSYGLVSLVHKDQLVSDVSPVTLRKAIKNSEEIECMKNAHIKDAVALCEFFSWLEKNVTNNNITELSASAELEKFRSFQKDHIGPSFETISASGPNASMAHYSATPESNRTINLNEYYLCDSGGQYRDGTTDVTRTVHYGVPTAFEKECYTRVVKCHINLSSATFPAFIIGRAVDSFARRALWDVGLDYMHGTGHGVGMYLNVHEGPMGISWRPYPNDPGLQEGMIMSIEPGYYEDNKFGIRIENLAVIVKADTKHTFKKKSFLTFEPITLVPLQTNLLEPSLLTEQEINWINHYHSKCRDIIGDILRKEGKKEAMEWLMKMTLLLG